MIKNILIAIGFVVSLALSFWLGSRLGWFSTSEYQDATVLLEKVKKVSKLIAVEGYLSEIYEYEQKNDLLDIPILFGKKALIRVNAKASVGYDFEKMIKKKK